MNTPPPPPGEMSFEQALAELESVVRALEDGNLALEESLARYESGVSLLKRCYGQLRQAEQRILLLAGVDEEGRPVTQPFEQSAVEPDNGRTPRRRPPER
jgi:exodeoxyribonuclease VII small subunit